MYQRWLMSDPCIGPVVSASVVNFGLSYWTSCVTSQHAPLIATWNHGIVPVLLTLVVDVGPLYWTSSFSPGN